MPLHDLLGRGPVQQRPDFLEKYVSLAIQEFLRAEGWQVCAANAEVLKRSKDRQSEPDVADVWAVRIAVIGTFIKVPDIQVLFIEAKRPPYRDRAGKLRRSLPTSGQRRWAEERVAEGFTVVWADDFDQFKQWYQEHYG